MLQLSECSFDCKNCSLQVLSPQKYQWPDKYQDQLSPLKIIDQCSTNYWIYSWDSSVTSSLKTRLCNWRSSFWNQKYLQRSILKMFVTTMFFFGSLNHYLGALVAVNIFIIIQSTHQWVINNLAQWKSIRFMILRYLVQVLTFLASFNIFLSKFFNRNVKI